MVVFSIWKTQEICIRLPGYFRKEFSAEDMRKGSVPGMPPRVLLGDQARVRWMATWGCGHAKMLHLCLTQWYSRGCSPPRSPVHGILQARILVWIVMLSSRGPSRPRDRTCVSCISCIAGGFFTTKLAGKLNVRILTTFHRWGKVEIPGQLWK